MHGQNQQTPWELRLRKRPARESLHLLAKRLGRLALPCGVVTGALVSLSLWCWGAEVGDGFTAAGRVPMKPVLTVLRTVPDSPGFIVAKMDRSEIGEPQRRQAVLTFALTAFLAGSAGLLVGLVAQRGQKVSALRESEQRLAEVQLLNQSLLDFSPVGIIAYAASGECLFANAVAARIIGGTGEQTSRQNFRRLASWKESGLLAAADTALTQGVEQQIHAHFVTTFGKEIWLQAYLTAFRHQDQLHLLVIVADITEQKKIEADLLTSRKRVFDVIENTPAGYFFIGQDGRFKHVNPAWLKMHGFSALEEVVGSHFSITLTQTDTKAAEGVVARVMGGERIVSGTSTRRLKNGSIGFHLYSANPVYESDQVIGLEGFLIDLTDYRRAQEALAESRAQLAATIESTTDLIWSVDAEKFGLIMFNGSFRDSSILNVGAEPRVGMTPQELMAPDSVDLWRELYRRTLREGSLKTDFVAGDQAKTLLLSFSLVSREGEVVGISVIARDITERIAADTALRQSEERFRTLIEKAPVAVAITRDGLNVYGNSRYLELFGFESMDSLRGRPIAEQWAPQYREVLAERVRRRAMGLPTPTEYDGVGLRRDGGQFPMQVVVSTVHLADGPATIAFVLDLTERKRAQEAVARNEAELTAIYENTPFMMCLVNAQHQIERMNRTMARFAASDEAPAALQRHGYVLGCINAHDAARGCGFGKECHACAVRLAVRKTFETGEPCRQVQGDLQLVLAGVPRELHVSVSTALVQLRNQPKVLVCLEDVTAHRQMEMQLRHAQKMEAVGQLAGGIAHDFNNILAASLLHLDLLQTTPDLQPDVVASLKELEQGMHRAAHLTRQLLLFSRREVMQVQRVAINELIGGLVKMLKRLLGEHITIDFRPTAESAALEADPGMIEQVVINLSVNARDAMPKGGRLTLTTQLLDMTAQDACRHPDARVGRFVCLTVKDNGCGIDESTLKRIFEPFFTTKGPGKGTGLGLATVYGIVQQHRGWVEVESAVGCGTSFCVFLPATDSIQRPETRKTKAKPTGGTETILLVEDEPRVRYAIKMTLRLLGYEILEASNGIEALRVWEKNASRVSLLLTDMVMPEGLTGLDLARQLREHRPDLKVIISSGYSVDLVDLQRPPMAGVKYLAKPYDPPSLARMVRESLDQPG